MHAVLRYANGDRRVFQLDETHLDKGCPPRSIEVQGDVFVLAESRSPGLPAYVECTRDEYGNVWLKQPEK